MGVLPSLLAAFTTVSQLGSGDYMHKLVQVLMRGFIQTRQRCSRCSRGGSSAYEPALGGITTPFQPDKVSLPDTVRDAPLLQRLLPEPCLSFLEDGLQRMRLPGEQVPMGDLPNAHWAPALSGLAYIQFLASLHQRGMLQFTLMFEEEAGIFS